MISLLKNLYEQQMAAFREAAKNLQKIYRTIAEYQRMIAIQVELMKQFKTTIEEGMDNFEEPQKYSADAVKSHPCTEEFTFPCDPNFMGLCSL